MSLRTWRRLVPQEDLIWRALAIGFVCGPILTALGELLRLGTEPHVMWRALRVILTLPGVLYTAFTGRDPFLSLSEMGVYFLVQIVYVTVIVFVFLATARFLAPRKDTGA